MRIQCPSCQASYEVAEGLLQKPRKVRCAQCGRDWLASADPPVPEPPANNATAANPPAAAAAEPAPAGRVAAIAKPPAAPDQETAPAADDQLAFEEGLAGELSATDPRPDIEPGEHEPDGEPPLASIQRLSSLENPAEPTARDRFALRVAWVLSVAALIGLGTIGYIDRGVIMDHWPASTRIYRTLGLAAPPAQPVQDGGTLGQASSAHDDARRQATPKD